MKKLSTSEDEQLTGDTRTIRSHPGLAASQLRPAGGASPLCVRHFVSFSADAIAASWSLLPPSGSQGSRKRTAEVSPRPRESFRAGRPPRADLPDGHVPSARPPADCVLLCVPASPGRWPPALPAHSARGPDAGQGRRGVGAAACTALVEPGRVHPTWSLPTWSRRETEAMGGLTSQIEIRGFLLKSSPKLPCLPPRRPSH